MGGASSVEAASLERLGKDDKAFVLAELVSPWAAPRPARRPCSYRAQIPSPSQAAAYTKASSSGAAPSNSDVFGALSPKAKALLAEVGVMAGADGKPEEGTPSPEGA